MAWLWWVLGFHGFLPSPVKRGLKVEGVGGGEPVGDFVTVILLSQILPNFLCGVESGWFVHGYSPSFRCLVVLANAPLVSFRRLP